MSLLILLLTNSETKLLKKIILVHIYRVRLDLTYKKINEITSYDLIANILSVLF